MALSHYSVWVQLEEDQLSQNSCVPLHRDLGTKLSRVVLSAETKRSVCLTGCVCARVCVYELMFLSSFLPHCPADMESVQRPYYNKFLLSSPRPPCSLCGRKLGHKKEKSLGHFQNDFHCCISAFGRMQSGTCQEREEIKDPRVRAWSGPIEVWLEEDCCRLLPRPSRANWRIWSSGGNSMRWGRRISWNKWERLPEFGGRLLLLSPWPRLGYSGAFERRGHTITARVRWRQTRRKPWKPPLN